MICAISTLSICDPLSLASSTGIALSADESTLYVTDQIGNRLGAVNLSSRVVRIIAGTGETCTAGGMSCDGPALCARLNKPTGIAVNASSGAIFFTELRDTNRVRLFFNGTVRTIAGDYYPSTPPGGTCQLLDGVGTAARFCRPIGIALLSSASRILFVTDTFNYRIRLVRVADSIGSPATVMTLEGVTGCTGAIPFADMMGIVSLNRDEFAFVNIGEMPTASCITVVNTTGINLNSSQQPTVPESQLWRLAVPKLDGARDIAWLQRQESILATKNTRIAIVATNGTVSWIDSGNFSYSVDGIGTQASFQYASHFAVLSSGEFYLSEFSPAGGSKQARIRFFNCSLNASLPLPAPSCGAATPSPSPPICPSLAPTLSPSVSSAATRTMISMSDTYTPLPTLSPSSTLTISASFVLSPSAAGSFVLSKTVTFKAATSASPVPTVTKTISFTYSTARSLTPSPSRSETTAVSSANSTAAIAAPAQQAVPVVVIGLLPPLFCCLLAALLIYFARRRRAASRLTSIRPKAEAAANLSNVLTMLNPLHHRPASRVEGGAAEEENPLPVSADAPDRPSVQSSASAREDSDAEMLPVREADADSEEDMVGAQDTSSDTSPLKRRANVLDIRRSRKQQAYKKVVDANTRLASINALLGAHRAIAVFTRRTTIDETTAALLVQRAWRVRRMTRLRSHWDHVAKFDRVEHMSDSRRVVSRVVLVDEDDSTVTTTIAVGRKAKAEAEAAETSIQEEGGTIATADTTSQDQ